MLREHFEKHAENVFIIDARQDDIYTYEAFLKAIAGVSEYLIESGIRRGDRVLVSAPNSAEFAALYFSAIDLGFTIVPVSPNLNPKELQFVMESSRASFWVSQAKDLPMGETGALKKISLQTLSSRAKPRDPFSDSRRCGNDIFSILYTSGTTSQPKGVAHAIDRMVVNALDFIRTLDIRPEQRFYNILSMSYMAGFYNLILVPFLAGASVVIDDVLTPKQVLHFWKQPIRYRADTFWFVPTLLSLLLKLDRGDEGRRYCREVVRKIFVGTAPLPVALRKAFEDRYGQRLYESYGLSETLFISAVTDETLHQYGSVGKILPTCAVKIENGEILVRTPSLMLGYLDSKTGHPEGEARGISGYFPTGDIGHLDETGTLYITGRKKDLIIRGGINISPRAIENVLMEMEGVESAAVIGISHPIFGEEIAAIVKMKPGYDFVQVKPLLKQRCKLGLSQIQQPAFFFEIEEFPLTSNGKIHKEKLKAIVSVRLVS